MTTRSPALMGTPPIVVSCNAVRCCEISGEVYRTISSTAEEGLSRLNSSH
ncbi:Uncharacterised protein [Mycobacteroides abscessus subsp. massiliense]|nr:Uncharacterised protein [Mycobacteroides abscessus subsp. massiliense]